MTISNPTNLSNLVRGKSSTIQDYAIKQREKQTIIKKHQDKCRQMNSDFVPFSILKIAEYVQESLNYFLNKSFKKPLQRMNDICCSTLLSYWRRRISSAPQISNADILTKAYIYLSD